MSGEYENLPDEYDRIKADFDEYDGSDNNGDENYDDEMTEEELAEAEMEMREIEMDAYAEGFVGGWGESSEAETDDCAEENSGTEDENSAKTNKTKEDEKLWDESFPDDIPF